MNGSAIDIGSGALQVAGQGGSVGRSPRLEGNKVRIQALGFCRFSVLVTEGFQKMPDALEERRAALYEPARLSQRLTWFEHVFLPGLRKQTDPDFTMIVATGEDLPDPWRSRLVALTATVPQISLVFVGPCRYSAVAQETIAAHIDPAADVIAQFRQDDDDAVSVDFVQRLRRDFNTRLRGLYDVQLKLMLDYARGFMLSATNGALSLYPVTAQSWALAQVLYLPPDSAESMMTFHHKNIFRHMTTVSLIDRPMYIRGVHDWNDSGVRDYKHPKAVEPERAAEWVSHRFNVDLDALGHALRVRSA
ncbi:MAG: glycosyltransferase [Albidovulum sp.]